MDTTEERIERLEQARRRDRRMIIALALGLPATMVLSGAILPRGGAPAVSSRLVTQSLVIVDQDHRPRIDLGTDPDLGARLFLHDAEGHPLVGLSGQPGSGSFTIFDQTGHAVAALGSSGMGAGLLRLSDPRGQTNVRLGQWGGAAGAQLWTASNADADQDSE